MDSYYKFVHVYKDDRGNRDEIKMRTESIDKTELLKYFENFLRACGYTIEGEFVEVEE